jgi:beta-catenin-like protein 1
LQAVKALDFALTGPEGAKGCVRFVESMGLGPLFSLLMGKVRVLVRGSPHYAHTALCQGAKKHDAATSSDEEHMLGLIVSLLNNLESESPARIRLLAKFVEDDYEKADRLLELFETSEGRLQAVEAEIKAEQAVSRRDLPPASSCAHACTPAGA